MNISGLFNICLRQPLDENGTSRINGLAGEGLIRSVYTEKTKQTTTNKKKSTRGAGGSVVPVVPATFSRKGEVLLERSKALTVERCARGVET